MKYSIPDKRELNDKEKKLLAFLFNKKKPEWLDIINKIKVIARCGCGKCPTVLFGISFEEETKTNQPLLIDYMGTGKNGELIGVALFSNNKIPTELEFWSINGQTDVIEFPDLETLKPMEEM